MKKADVILKRPSTFSVCIKGLFLLGVLYVLVALEATWPRKLSFFGEIPRVTRTFLILFSLKEKGILSMVVSAVSGLFLSVVCGKAVPTDALFYLYISFWCVWSGRRMYVEKRKRYFVAVFAFSVIGSLTEAVVLAALGVGTMKGVFSLFCEGAINVLFVFVLWPLVKLCTNERERGNEKRE